MCPNCATALVAFELEGIEIDSCVQCGGTWLDSGELAMIAERAGVAAGGLTQALEAGGSPGVGKGRCPRCGARLRRVAIGQDKPVALDRCPRGHGLWFDKGEMNAVVAQFAEAHGAETGAVARFFGDVFRHQLDTTKEGE